MGKRIPALPDWQLSFTFEVPSVARFDGELAGLGRIVASACARALKEDPRSREHIASSMRSLLNEDVSKFMLDAYSSEARTEHNISAERLLALIAVTKRFDILDALLMRIGARVLIGDEMNTLRLGSLMAAKAELEDEIRSLRAVAKPINRGGRG